jgi:hypothetical protein
MSVEALIERNDDRSGNSLFFGAWNGSCNALRFFVAAAVLLSGAHALARTSETFEPSAFLKDHCIRCHNDEQWRGGWSLEGVDVERPLTDHEIWEKVVGKLRHREMPPPSTGTNGKKNRPPDEASYASMIDLLETSIDHALVNQPNPGRPAVHRLNRSEYANAIRDLVAVEIDGRSLLPADAAEFGFDNIADSLTVSPMLLDRYMAAASKISRLAIGDPAVHPSIQTYEVSKLLAQRDRMSEELPFGSRGGMVVRHHFPLDAEYVIKVDTSGRRREDLEVRVDGQRLALFEASGGRSGRPGGSRSDLEVRFRAKAGTRPIAISFLQRTLAPEGVAPRKLPVGSISGPGSGVASFAIAGPYDATGLGEDSPSRKKIFTRYPVDADDELASATEILSTLARRAFRRPVTADDMDTLLDFYAEGRREGGFEAGIAWVLEAILADPEFLFRVEAAPDIAPNTAYFVSDLELASRLSFFLWSSIPDDELLDAAERGQLRDPVVLESQVRRMLSDARAEALVTNFAAQWLYLRNMRAVMPDLNLFPEFDDNLRGAMQRETELFVASQLAADRSVVDLLTADYTFLNERLARHYGVAGIHGNRFRRVTLEDENRFGLLGQGSILTVTSYATRTSPVLRGKWVLENVLGSPPAAPPANVPSLPEATEVGFEATTVRERMQQHRKDPVCASCHVKMDPIGFALENFDGIGRWRVTGEDGMPLDATGSFPDGSTFHGPVGLRQVLLKQSEEFVTNVTHKLLTYALGRGVEYYDYPAIRKITRDAAAEDHRWSSIVLGIAQSTPFQMRRSGP